MYRLFLLLCFFITSQAVTAQWRPARSPLSTHWAMGVSPDNVWPEYPRPQMQRQEWMNLNGLWDLIILKSKDGAPAYTGKILVPFPVESSLSGVGNRVEPENVLTYRREVTMPEQWSGQRILLHFGASDWETEVLVNGKTVGAHLGGYDPFSFDITDFIGGNNTFNVAVRVTDPTDQGGQAIGKQRLRPSGIWYTATSGIWQTVWLEPVPKNYVRSFRVEPDIDKNRVIVRVEPGGDKSRNVTVRTRVMKDGRIVSESTGKGATPHLLPVPEARLWSPNDPFLYDLEITLTDPDNNTADQVKSYFGMRKISVAKDANGVPRLMLNNEFVFQLGPLDQGFWPDGLYTPPSEAAMKNDLQVLKDMGFNMIRKHVKVEPSRWYYLCDQMGFLVWQDMPSAANTTSEDRQQFKWELKAMVDALFNHPSIVMWVPFNEGWGQHDTEFYVHSLKEWDPTRLVNNASGWTDMGVGDVNDIHAYPGPAAPEIVHSPQSSVLSGETGAQKNGEQRAGVLGEFGGLGLNVPGHSWSKLGWGYELIKSPDELLSRYEELYQKLLPLIDSAGLSAAVYTQVSDVESENNGLMTYDRKVIKMDPSLMVLAHRGYLPPRPANDARIFTKKTTVTLACGKNISGQKEASIVYTLDETLPLGKWKTYKGPLKLRKSKTIRCRATWPDGTNSRSHSYSFTKVKAVKSTAPKVLQPGISLKLFEGTWDSLPVFDTLQSARQFTVQQFSLDSVKMESDYALLYEGWVEAPVTGTYTFYCNSDDGSRMYVAHQKLIENDGLHGMRTQNGSIVLKKGKHPVRLEFFQKKGGQGLEVWYEDPEGKKVSGQEVRLFN